jgi:hypothetical protein
MQGVYADRSCRNPRLVGRPATYTDSEQRRRQQQIMASALAGHTSCHGKRWNKAYGIEKASNTHTARFCKPAVYSQQKEGKYDMQDHFLKDW